MYDLDPESAAELAEICETAGSHGDRLRSAVQRVCENPSGQREPRHRYTKKFHNSSRYPQIPKGTKIHEFTTNHWRGLFRLVEVKKATEIHRLLVFIPIRGSRFFPIDDCPWH